MRTRNIKPGFFDDENRSRGGEGMRINVTPHYTQDQARAYTLQCFLNAIAQEGKPLFSCLPFPISKAGRRMAEAMQDMDITDEE